MIFQNECRSVRTLNTPFFKMTDRTGIYLNVSLLCFTCNQTIQINTESSEYLSNMSDVSMVHGTEDIPRKWQEGGLQNIRHPPEFQWSIGQTTSPTPHRWQDGVTSQSNLSNVDCIVIIELECPGATSHLVNISHD